MKTLTPEALARLEYMKASIIQKQCYVTYWTAFAISSANHSRVVYKNSNDPLDAIGLEKDAFDTALDHLYSIEETKDEIDKLLRDSNSWVAPYWNGHTWQK